MGVNIVDNKQNKYLSNLNDKKLDMFRNLKTSNSTSLIIIVIITLKNSSIIKKQNTIYTILKGSQKTLTSFELEYYGLVYV